MPTTSRSSPTTTSAVNENRRPPLTTLATRLISTTRSWRSRPAAETERSRDIRLIQSSDLEVQAALAGSVGERLDAPMESIATTVEHHGLDAGGLGTLGEEGAGAGGLLHRLQRAQLRLRPRDRRNGPPRVVVDQLGEQTAIRAE